MAAGDILRKWSSWTSLAVTNLHSLPTSSTYVNGWESAVIDINTAGYDDVEITAQITVAAAGLSAAQIRLSLAPLLDDSTYASNLDGTESTEAPLFADTEMQAAFARIAAVTDTDTTASDVYYLHVPSVSAIFGGSIPNRFSILIAHATGANLAASGNAVKWRGSYYQLQS